MPRNFYIKESQLDIQQRNLVNKRLDQNLVVTGGAGSGKSILALWKAKEIQDQGKSVLYVVKTVSLTEFMREGISDVGLKPGTVRSYNKCFQFRKNEDGDWVNLGWKLADYDYIILDEATDLTIPEVKELINHCKYFIAFGDNDQQLFSFAGTTTTVDDIARDMGMDPENDMDHLIFNHRLPKTVARLVVYAHPSININGLTGNVNAQEYITRCTNEGVEKPHIIGFQSESEELDHIIKIIKNKNGGLKDVGILFRDKDSMQRAYDYFKENDLPAMMIKDGHFTGTFRSDTPKLMTYHSSKGLQFETVFLPNCGGSATDIAPLYVALTRTYSSLYVMYTGAFPLIFQNVPNGIYVNN